MIENVFCTSHVIGHTVHARIHVYLFNSSHDNIQLYPQVHRALLIISLFVGAAGFILIFIALSNTNGLVNINSVSEHTDHAWMDIVY